MAKIFKKCELCKATKFVNSADLCKRCAKKPASAEIKRKYAAHVKEDLKADSASIKHNNQDAAELHILEEKKDLTAEEKQRIMTLKPEIGSLVELDKYLEEKHNPKDAEPVAEPKKSE